MTTSSFAIACGNNLRRLKTQHQLDVTAVQGLAANLRRHAGLCGAEHLVPRIDGLEVELLGLIRLEWQRRHADIIC